MAEACEIIPKYKQRLRKKHPATSVLSAGLPPSLSSGIIHRHARSHGNSSASLSLHPNSRSLSVALIAAEDCGEQKYKKTDIERGVPTSVPTSVGIYGGAKIAHTRFIKY